MNILIDNRTNGTLVNMLAKQTNWRLENQYTFLERTKNEGFSIDTKYVIGEVDQKILLLNRFHSNNIIPFTTQPIIDWNLNPKQLSSCISGLPPLYIVRQHVRILTKPIDTFFELGPLYYFEIRAELPLNIDFDEVLVEVFDSILSTLGPVDELSARSRNLRGNRSQPDVLLVQTLLRNGIEGHLFINALDAKVGHGDVRINIYGRDGSLNEDLTIGKVVFAEYDSVPNYNAYVFLKWVHRACRSESLVHLKDLNS
ncbi:MAG: hypothetical protein VX294_13550 [Candidatus Latescibacterota bacterium]|nr:hypothetical protein [Candidatus Latescibacterota bacterium]